MPDQQQEYLESKKLLEVAASKAGS